ncbi:MAG: sulfatase [Chitinophagaceae bacterium]
MRRKQQHFFVFLFIVALHFYLPGTAQSGRGSRPNVIVLLADDLGWSDTQCYGSSYYETPNIDALARSGMRFTDAYSACTVCSPSRASMLTGKYPGRLHVTDWITGYQRPFAKLLPPPWTAFLAQEELTIAEVLKKQNYVTAMIGKWHLGDDVKYYPEQQGFDNNIGGTFQGSPPSYFSPYRNARLSDGPRGEYLTDRLTDEAMDFIRREKENPFFLYLSFYAVHTPLQAKESDVALYKEKIKTASNQQNPLYAAMVHNLDENIGRLYQLVKQLGLSRNTLIIFTSDNGGLIKGDNWAKGKITSNHPLRGGKGTPYEGGTRVPLICSWEGKIKAGSLSKQPVIGADLFPTIVAAAGNDPSKLNVDGVNLLPLLKGNTNIKRPALFWHYPHYHSEGATPYSAIRKNDWKLIYSFEDGRKELYNLLKDQGEKNNLSARDPERTDALYKELVIWQKEVAAQLPTSNPAYDSTKEKLGGGAQKRTVKDTRTVEENE